MGWWLFIWVVVGSGTLRSSSRVERQKVRNSDVDPEEGPLQEERGWRANWSGKCELLTEPSLYLLLGKRGALLESVNGCQ